MKQVKKWLFAVALAAIALNAQASNGDGDLNRSIRKTISYPEFGRSEKLNGVVYVEYEVDKFGKIHVKQVNGSHAGLEAYVCKKLNTVTVTNVDAIGTHFAKFKFRFVSM